ncbi:MAG: response regulator transcription factor [Dehalococcoidia bacterium]
MTDQVRPVVLIADDDASILKLVRLQLVDEGFRAVTASTGEEAVQRAIDERPDLVVLDIMLPDISGFEVLNRLRERGPIPVILLTGKTRDSDKIRGLEMGADDYLAKPFNPEELAARVRAVLRRARRDGGGSDEPVHIGPLMIDLERRIVERDGELVPLTRTEWNLLEVLVRNQGKALMNPEILGKVWGPEYVDDLQYLRVWISRLRRKLEPDRPEDSIIRTFPGMGYMFRDTRVEPADDGSVGAEDDSDLDVAVADEDDE